MNRLFVILLTGILLAPPLALAEDKLEFGTDEPILVKADEAWEEPRRGCDPLPRQLRDEWRDVGGVCR